MSKEVRSTTYLDTSSSVRTLVSIYENDKPIQTIGSWEVSDAVIPEVLKACVYTLNSLTGKETPVD